MNDESPFLFVTCQRGVESALKLDVVRQHPAFRFAYSRPGLVTFKLPPGTNVDHITLESAFARTFGETLGRVEGAADQETATAIGGLIGEREFKQLHLWQRDSAVPGDHRFEPGVNESSSQLAQGFVEHLRGQGLPANVQPNQVARRNQRVLDLIEVEPQQWLVGGHVASTVVGRWPAGVPKIARPEEIVSRAYLKMQEALAWSRFPLVEDEPWVELGSSPGGSCQALLERGVNVTGIDPAPMHELLLKHERFRHVQKRSDDVRLKDFRSLRWLAADLNVAPQTTLDTVERVTSAEGVHLRGLLLTLKLLDQDMYGRVQEYRQRVQGWGFAQVRVRQLAFNRQEFCLAALRSRGALRRKPQRKRPTKNRRRK